MRHRLIPLILVVMLLINYDAYALRPLASDELADRNPHLRETVIRVISQRYNDFVYSRAGWSHKDPVSGATIIHPSKGVKYGRFEITPVYMEDLDSLAEFAGIRKGKRVFEFGHGDGSTAFTFAAYGAYVDGYEEDLPLYRISKNTKNWFVHKMRTRMIGASEDLMEAILEAANRVNFYHGDIFHEQIDFS
ncbi:MAG: hypothetical protein ABH825_03180, partial [Candidatus Omnitrophota bacterium]